MSDLDRCIRAIDEIPGGDGWWRESGREEYQRLADVLHNHGVPCDTTTDVLSRAYHAAAAEFGN